MSTSRDSCCLPSVKKQKYDFQVFAFVQCIIKQLLDSVLWISRIIKVSVRVISLSLRLITLTSTLIILDITKTSSNNCLLLYTELSNPFLIGQKCIVNFRNQRPSRHNCRLLQTIIYELNTYKENSMFLVAITFASQIVGHIA